MDGERKHYAYFVNAERDVRRDAGCAEWPPALPAGIGIAATHWSAIPTADFMWRDSTLAMVSALPPIHHVAIDSLRCCNIRGAEFRVALSPYQSPLAMRRGRKMIDVWLTFRMMPDLR